MKLVRFGPPSFEKPGLVDAQGHLRDLSGHVEDIGPTVVSPEGLARLKTIPPSDLPLIPGDTRLGPPVSGVSKIVAAGLNYVDHVAETGLPSPTEPLLFMKATTALCGARDSIVIPKGGAKVDWEVELAVVIGSRASYVPVERALEHVAGYCIMNDVSERAFQMERGGQFMKGKCADTFAPLGPWLVTADEVGDPRKLKMFCEVNGILMQEASTADMIFPVDVLVSYVSQFMTLLPGDVLSTGTPAGTGIGMRPPRFLQLGDCVRLGISKLGEQCQEVARYVGT